MAIVFVLGTGRCGTVTLARVLASIPDMVVLHEGLNRIAGMSVKPLVDEFGQACRHEAEQAVMRRLFGQERLDFIRACVTQGQHFGEANHYAYPFVTFLRREFPDARFIHLVRNGYDTVVSWRARKDGIYPKPGTEITRWAAANPVPAPGDPWHERWDSLDRREKISWFWAHVNDFIASRLAPLPAERRMTLRLEELDAAKLNEIGCFLGVTHDWDASLLLAYNQSKKPLRRDWTTSQLRRFREIAGPAMERLGYTVFDNETDFISVTRHNRERLLSSPLEAGVTAAEVRTP